MTRHILVTVFGPDRTGIVAAVSDRLFDLGANLGDTTFAVLGSGAEFTSVCAFPDDLTPAEIKAELKSLPELAGAKISAEPFGLSPVVQPSGRITHRIWLNGGDQPGLLARLSEVLLQFNANIVRLEARQIPDAPQSQYETQFAVWIPDDKAKVCLATIANTAGELSLTCRWQAT